ncbi:hypothetical protein SAMN02745166_03087 [Prosthecobacter debontii]|uniref:Uncharacterized protein n=1 Tax=Prosthecobacter debontii TaxID=48467 RepID=A0A1T4YED1_9BACT|nr:hypothetical protein SAMN02745166_03087 [Prosthecobacter debontii]
MLLYVYSLLRRTVSLVCCNIDISASRSAYFEVMDELEGPSDQGLKEFVQHDALRWLS